MEKNDVKRETPKIIKIMCSPWTLGALTICSIIGLGGAVAREHRKNEKLTTRVSELERTVSEHEGEIKELNRHNKKLSRDNMSLCYRNHDLSVQNQQMLNKN